MVEGPHASQMMKRIEKILADHQFLDFLLDAFKPNHGITCLNTLIVHIDKAQKDPAQIAEAKYKTQELDWNVAADLLNELRPLDEDADLPNLPNRGTDIPRSIDFGRDLPSLIAQDLTRSRRACEELVESYKGEASPRRPTVKARRETVRDLVRCFQIHSPLDPDADDNRILPDKEIVSKYGYVDRICEFVELALRSAGIAAPASGDTMRGEQYEGRLRKEIKRILRHARGV